MLMFLSDVEHLSKCLLAICISLSCDMEKGLGSLQSHRSWPHRCLNLSAFSLYDFRRVVSSLWDPISLSRSQVETMGRTSAWLRGRRLSLSELGHGLDTGRIFRADAWAAGHTQS